MVTRLCYAVLCLLASVAVGRAETLTIATWNIEHLVAAPGQGPNPRQDADFARLRRYATQLNADIVALQEVDGLAAAAKVFDPAVYAVFFSRRHHPQRTGFAVRKTLQVTQHPDVTTLNVTGGLRHGTDITVRVGTTTLRLLAVHLKSGCFDRPLSSSSDACRKLKRQVRPLEAWIDARAAEATPFIVLGDWNRRFDAPDDTFWSDIDDGVPANADLTRVTTGRTSACWGGQFPRYIDHIALDARTAPWVVAGSFRQVVYTEGRAFKDVLSDHCPIAVTLNAGGTGPVVTRQALLARITALERALAALRQLVEQMAP